MDEQKLNGDEFLEEELGEQDPSKLAAEAEKNLSEIKFSVRDLARMNPPHIEMVSEFFEHYGESERSLTDIIGCADFWAGKTEKLGHGSIPEVIRGIQGDVVVFLLARADIAEEMIHLGVWVNLKDRQGRTALHYAAQWDDDRRIDLLMCHGADVTLQNNNGWTPLHVAAYVCNPAAVRELVLNAQSDNILLVRENLFGKNALELSMLVNIQTESDRADVVEFLKEKTAWAVERKNYVSFSDVAHYLLHQQDQYASYYITGFGDRPALGEGLRFKMKDGREFGFDDYHSILIHRDDVREFIRRYDDNLKKCGCDPIKLTEKEWARVLGE